MIKQLSAGSFYLRHFICNNASQSVLQNRLTAVVFSLTESNEGRVGGKRGLQGVSPVGRSRRLELVRTPVAGCPLTGHAPSQPSPSRGRSSTSLFCSLPGLGSGFPDGRHDQRELVRVARRIFCRAESSPKGERARNVSSSVVSDKNPKDFVTNVRSVESRIIRKRSRSICTNVDLCNNLCDS